MNSKLISKLDVVAFVCSHADVPALWHTAPSSHDRAGPAGAGSALHRVAVLLLNQRYQKESHGTYTVLESNHVPGLRWPQVIISR